MKTLATFLISLLLLGGCASTNFSHEKKTDYAYKVKQPSLDQPNYDHPQVITLQQQYKAWLDDASITPNRIDVLVAAASPSLQHLVELAEGATVEMEFPDWFVAGGKIPEDTQAEHVLSLESIPSGTMPTNFKQPSVQSAAYLGHVFIVNRCSSSAQHRLSGTLSLAEYRHFHQFLLAKKLWTVHDFTIAENAVAQIKLNDSFTQSVLC